MKPSPGSAVIRTLIQSESTLVPPVTAERSPPDSRITGADSPVIADSSTEAMPFDDLAVARDQFARRHHHDVAGAQVRGLHGLLAAVGGEPPGHEVGAGAPQRLGLRLAAPLRHRLGEVREQHGEPQPEPDRRCRTRPHRR